MAQLTEGILRRLQQLLLQKPEVLQRSDGMFSNHSTLSAGQGWCLSAAAVIVAVVQDPAHPYREATTRALEHIQKNPAGTCSALHGALLQLEADFQAGLFSSLAAQVSAQTFDDVLDHAEHYLANKRPEPAGVLAGVIFEDTVRRLCDKHAIAQDGVQMDTLLSELARKSVITPLERKEGTTAAGLRTSATHARWSEFTSEQVETVIRLTRRFIREKLAA